MPINFLVRTFIKDYTNTGNPEIRKRYGYLGGTVGIAANILLFAVKFLSGLIVNSIAVMADSFNNLSDAASSIVTILGFYVAGKPPDEKHPFGYGRIEYIAGMIVSFLIILLGYEFFKSALSRILNPVPLRFYLPAFVILLVSILVKGWLARFNKQLGAAIGSHALEATALDSISDMISTACVALSLLASRWTDFPLDGYIGVIVAVIIFYSGIKSTRETISPLLGEESSAELIREIRETVLEYEGIKGVHDLIIHSYGPGRQMVSLHAEVSSDHDLMDLHELIDRVEREVAHKLNILLTIHMDPLNTSSGESVRLQEELRTVLNLFPQVLSFHDFRFVGRGDTLNLLFDIVVKPGMKESEKAELRRGINQKMREIHPGYTCVITVDQAYSAC